MTDTEFDVLDNDEHDSDKGGNLRDKFEAQLAEKDAEIVELRADKRDRALDDSKLTGPARKAVEKDLKRGDYAGDVTAEGLREYAVEEYEWTAPSDDGDPEPKEVDDATRERMESQKSRDDLAASSHARGDSEEKNPEAQQAQVDEKLDAGDVQGAVYDELLNKVSRTT